jgi:hypothetical protein
VLGSLYADAFNFAHSLTAIKATVWWFWLIYAASNLQLSRASAGLPSSNNFSKSLMDASHLSVIASAIGTAKDITKTLLGIRDFKLVAEQTAALNDSLLKAQDALLSHNTALLQLQDEHFKAREELRKLRKALNERGRYSLVELASDNFAYRVNISPEQSGTSQPGVPEPAHYVCQKCFDKGIKAVLVGAIIKNTRGFSNGLLCPECGHGVAK